MEILQTYTQVCIHTSRYGRVEDIGSTWRRSPVQDEVSTMHPWSEGTTGVNHNTSITTREQDKRIRQCGLRQKDDQDRPQCQLPQRRQRTSGKRRDHKSKYQHQHHKKKAGYMDHSIRKRRDYQSRSRPRNSSRKRRQANQDNRKRRLPE